MLVATAMRGRRCTIDGSVLQFIKKGNCLVAGDCPCKFGFKAEKEPIEIRFLRILLTKVGFLIVYSFERSTVHYFKKLTPKVCYICK
jgi:hypothetical protein